MRILTMFAIGYAAAVFGAVLLLPEGALIPLSVLCAALAPVCIALRPEGWKRRGRYAALLCLGAAAGLLWSWGYGRLVLDPARALDGRTVVLAGEAAGYPQETDYGASVLVRARLESGGEVTTLLYISRDHMDLQPGDTFSTVARCSLATRAASGEEITYYTAKGIFLTARAYGELSFTRPERIPLRCIPAVLSQRLKGSIDACFPEDAAPLIKALVTGNRDDLTDSYTTSLQRTGLSHVVAVSGMHLAFLAGAMGMLLGPGKRRTALAVLPAVGLFSLVAGCTPSVMRAAVMIVLLHLASLLGRERDDLTALATALLVLLVQNPYAAANVGLQLSFSSVAGIVLFSEKLQTGLLDRLKLKKAKKLSPRGLYNGLARFVVSVLSATAGALVFTTPLTALYFEKISLIAPLSNLLSLWAVSAAFTGGLVTGLLGLIHPGAGQAAAFLTVPFARYLQAVVPFLSKIPFASIPTTLYYRLWLVFVYAVLAAAALVPGRKRPHLSAVCCTAALGVAMVCSVFAYHTGSLRIDVLDVGQGQSVLIWSGGQLALVDCGGDRYENAGDIAADQIQALGRDTLDLLVISHYHTDHANGIPELLERIDVGQIVLPDVEEDSFLRRRILDQAQRYDIPVTFVREDLAVELGPDTVFTVYAPLGQGSTNELGLTVLCSAGDFDLLITGDMGTSVEALLVDHADLPDVELMVAGHHGSRYANSQLLLETVRPELAVFSVGADNSYGHPTQETLDRFLQIGAELYRTDQLGRVSVVVEAK